MADINNFYEQDFFFIKVMDEFRLWADRMSFGLAAATG